MRAGSVVSRPGTWPWVHFGLVSDAVGWDGRPLIIHASRLLGYVVEEPFQMFADGATRIRSHGYPSRLPVSVVLGRARSALGRRWDPTQHNCEHFVTWAHGLEPTSPQLQKAAAICLAPLLGVVAAEFLL